MAIWKETARVRRSQSRQANVLGAKSSEISNSRPLASSLADAMPAGLDAQRHDKTGHRHQYDGGSRSRVGVEGGDQAGDSGPGSAPVPGAGRGVPPRRTLRVESPQCTWETGSPRRRDADANTRDACAPRIPAPERPVFLAGSLAACEEPVLSLSKESHEAIAMFVSVGTYLELMAHRAVPSASRTVNGDITPAGLP